jgi:hypothetical protein
MENQVNKTGALKRAGWSPNAAMATILAAIGACMFGIANDRKAWVFADNEGNPFKTMCGTPTDDSNFTFTETVMQLPLPFTLAFGVQTAAGSKRIRITDDGMFFETTADGVNWVEMGAFF